MDDLTDAFVAESEEAISRLNAGLLELEGDPDGDTMDSVFRTAHTLKGNAGAMGFSTAADLAHALETLLDGVRQGDVPVTGETIDAAFAGVDEFQAMIDEVAESGEITRDPAATIREIEAVVDDAGGESDPATEGSDAGVSDADEETDAGVSDADDETRLATPTDEATETLREAAVETDRRVHHVRLRVLLGDLPEIDGSLAIDGVAEEVDVLGGDPDPDAIREGAFENPVDLLVASEDGPDEVAARLRAVPRIEDAVAVAVDDSGDTTDEADDVTTGDETDDPVTAADTAAGDATSDATTDEDGARVQSVRVDVDTLDTLYGLVEELVTSRIRLRGAIESGDLAAAEQELGELETATGDLQDTVMDARLVPLSTVASTLPRVVRDTARDCGKEATLVTDGEDVEMDRDVLEAIGDPLIHIVRNAVDHGIEPPAVRESAGKPREGTVELRAWRSRDQVTVEVSDDGAGLDPDVVREMAVEHGMLEPEAATALSDEAARELVFEPGFSTAGEVTAVSGRGVGMDVVASTVRELDGRVEIESDPGEGTTVRLHLPVSVAIARTLFVEVGNEEFGVPVSAVEEIGRLDETQTVEGREVVPLDGELYPLIRLGDALDVPGQVTGGMMVRARSSVRQVALGVDAVTGQEEVVIKPFDGVLEDIPGLSGATVLGEGRIVPVLDVETL